MMNQVRAVVAVAVAVDVGKAALVVVIVVVATTVIVCVVATAGLIANRRQRVKLLLCRGYVELVGHTLFKKRIK